MKKKSQRLYDITLLSLAIVFGFVLFRHEGLPVFQEVKVVALTYDDGPSQKSTEKLLDLLDKYDATATFFINGNHANDQKELVKEIARRGNEIGNHTLDHVWLTKTKEEEIERQIYGNENLLRFLSGQKGTMLFRPPYGDMNAVILEKIQVPVVMWSVDSRDWEITDVFKIEKNIMNDVADGDIIIMHDGFEATIQVTENILKRLTKDGFQVVTVSQMFELKNKQIPLHQKVRNVKE